MQDMGLDGAMKDMAANEAEIPVNSARCAAKERPSSGRIVRDRDVCMLKEGDGNYSVLAPTRATSRRQHTDPVIRPQVRKSVKQQHIPGSKPPNCQPKSRGSNCNADI